MNTPRKSRALPGAFSNEDAVTVVLAYEELSRSAFAVWMRLMAEHQSVLTEGKQKLFAILGYSPRRGSEVLAELNRKGYLQFIREDRVGAPISVVLRKRALVNSRTGQFVRIGNMLQNSVEKAHHKPLEKHTSLLNFGFRSIKLWSSVCANFDESNADGVPFPAILSVRIITPETHGVFLSAKLLDSTLPPPPVSTERKCRIPGLSNRKSKNSVVSLDRLRDSYSKDRSHRSVVRRTTAKRNSKRKGKPVNWTEVDKHGDPAVSFEPGHPDRRAVVEVLSRNQKDSERIHLVEKLTTEFCRIYTRYRKLAERRISGFSMYEVTHGERKHAATAAIACITKGVTPSHLIKYWDAHVMDFTNMKIPPLNFLASANNIDQAACSALPDKSKKGEKPKGGSTFSEEAGLDVRIRPALERAGFDTRPFNDRYLIGVQHNAMTIAKGRPIYMGKSKMADMSRWLAENLYKDIGGE